MRIYDIVFTPVLDPPDRIPPQRFDLRLRDVESGTQLIVNLLDFRHGRVLLLLTERARRKVIVCDPITGEQHDLSFPPKFEGTYVVNAAVLCAASERDHVHGSCHLSPFKVVLISYSGGVNRPIACAYSSKIGIWGDIISVDVPHRLVFAHIPGLLVGNALYWLLAIISDGILKFDLDEQSLAVINGPTIANDVYHASHWIIQLEDGAVAMAILSYPRFQMWQMDVSCHGVVTWMMLKTIDMHDIPGLPPQIEGNKATMKSIVGCVQHTNEFLLSVDDNVYMVQLKSMQSRKLCEYQHYSNYHCFKSFYPPGDYSFLVFILQE
uniref:F-box protein AT5G49610-like beta-propeller domain-containing protein n=1 Tax=Aegilops tauschii TaxID=37682 RepID=N1QR72_AEGTA